MACMKPTLPLILLVFLLSSCVQYQYMTVAGINLPKNEQNELTSENDTLKVLYRFLPNSGQISVRVYNKLNEPVEMIWNRSAVIMNDQAVGYYNPNQTFAGQLQADSWRFLRSTTTIGDIKGEIQAGEQVQFIPPMAFIESRPLDLPVRPLSYFPDEKAEKIPLVSIGGADAGITYKRLPFDRETSPSRFRSYLTFRLGRGEASREISLEHHFYISEVWKSAAGPDYFTSELANRGDRFYFSHNQ
jgi:hypothetical protein